MTEQAPARATAQDWSAQQYLQFEDERTRPPRDLHAVVKAYPPRFDGKVLLRFPRLFIVAVR